MYIEKKVKSILTELSGEGEISNTSTLQSDLVLDSLSMVSLLVEIEDVFDIRLDESDMNPFDLESVQSVIDMVRKYKEEEDE